MVKDHKVSHFRTLRNILFVILCITFVIGAWRVLTDTTPEGIPEAEKVFKEEKNLEK